MSKTRFWAIVISACFIFSFMPLRGKPLSQEDLDTAIDALTEQINRYMAEQKMTKIAIIPFPDLAKQSITVLGSFLAEELTTNLFTTKKFKIVERSLIKQVLEELKLGQTGIVDAASAKELGKMTGVDAIIAGTITDLGSSVAVNCRLIDTQSGEVFAAAKSRFIKDASISSLLGEIKQDAENEGLSDNDKKEEKRRKKGEITYEDVVRDINIGSSKTLKVEIVSFRVADDGKSVITYKITNLGDYPRNISLQSGSKNNYIADEDGNRYLYLSSSVIAEDSDFTLVKDVPVSFTLTYPKLADQIETINVVLDLYGFNITAFSNLDIR